jgi:hypothetical protein
VPRPAAALGFRAARRTRPRAFPRRRAPQRPPSKSSPFPRTMCQPCAASYGRTGRRRTTGRRGVLSMRAVQMSETSSLLRRDGEEPPPPCYLSGRRLVPRRPQSSPPRHGAAAVEPPPQPPPLPIDAPGEFPWTL